MDFMYGGVIGERAWFVISDSRNRHVRDNEMRLAAPNRMHREY